MDNTPSKDTVQLSPNPYGLFYLNSLMDEHINNASTPMIQSPLSG